MESVYLFFVVVLFTLAATDLMVGVSNDAVNFLNSAIGSKVASKRVIFTVAAIGIFVGATFSSGMMEIARKGIFNPEYFYFSDIMVIFLAVMISDIILLDVFNTFGMPTSTTVSIVFELLGAAVMVSILKLLGSGENLALVGDYINTEKALAIISGILLSVVVAFSVGALVQYLTRLLFSFNYHPRLKIVGAIWVGIAMTALSYFLLIKGLKGASFVSDGFVDWVKANTLALLGGSFIFWSVLMQVILLTTGKNILKFVVLFGTFALAMAFAGNDLVNFIGVPIAGFESFNAWKDSGAAPEAFNMGFLSEPVRTDTYLLVIAGLIMVVTLILSKKAQSVTETEVNLGRQNEGAERFSPNVASRFLVSTSLGIGNVISAVLPAGIASRIEANFKPVAMHDPNPPAFDLVRASVNLTMASVFIAFATSLKLPLSTTYVSFMVAMGTSLSDRAWDRESAVYRISGVLSVIGGWFMTAMVAFTMAAVFAYLIFKFGLSAVILLVVVAVIAIGRNFFTHKKRSARSKRKLLRVEEVTSLEAIKKEQQALIVNTFQSLNDGYKRAIDGLLTEDRKLLNRSRSELREMEKDYTNLKLSGHHLLKRLSFEKEEHAVILIDSLNCLQDLIQSLDFVATASRNHVLNRHKPLLPEQQKGLKQLKELIHEYFVNLSNHLKSNHSRPSAEEINKVLDALKQQQIRILSSESVSPKNTNLYFSLLLETQDIILDAQRLLKLHQSFTANP